LECSISTRKINPDPRKNIHKYSKIDGVSEDMGPEIQLRMLTVLLRSALTYDNKTQVLRSQDRK
jgi:hypothetical protein